VKAPGPAPAVAVVVPTFERRALVLEAVGSVLAQSVSALELVVVDDGSRDGTGEALAAVADERLSYLWQENRGPAAARNAGLRATSAPVVAFLDSDDRWLPDHLEVLLELLERHPRAVLVSACALFAHGKAPSAEAASLVDAKPLCFFHDRVGTPSCVAVRREAVLAAGAFDERLWAAEDSDLWARLSLQGPFCLLRRRSVVRSAGGEGLALRAAASGAYLEALACSARRTAEEVRGLAEPERERLRPAADAAVLLVDGVVALAARDAERARTALREACRLFPPLEREPVYVIPRLRHAGTTAAARLDALLLALRSWPSHDSPTARVLARDCLGLALRTGRLGAAAAIALRRPLALAALARFLLVRTARRARGRG